MTEKYDYRPDDFKIDFNPGSDSSEEEELNSPPKNFWIDKETEEIFDYLNEVVAFFRLTKLVSLRASGGWLREKLSQSLCSEQIDKAIEDLSKDKEFKPPTICHYALMKRDIDIFVLSKVPHKEFDIDAE